MAAIRPNPVSSIGIVVGVLFCGLNLYALYSGSEALALLGRCGIAGWLLQNVIGSHNAALIDHGLGLLFGLYLIHLSRQLRWR